MENAYQGLSNIYFNLDYQEEILGDPCLMNPVYHFIAEDQSFPYLETENYQSGIEDEGFKVEFKLNYLDCGTSVFNWMFIF
jgi:hypothetical protein